MNKKGISLPIETIVIIAVVVLVLVVISAFFILNIGKSGSSINDDAAFGQGCVILGTQYNCKYDTSNPVASKNEILNSIKINGYDPDGDGKPNSLRDACDRKGFTDSCWKACACPG